MLNVFAKSYNKWRVEKCVNSATPSKIQAIAVAEDCFTEGTYGIDNVCLKKDKYITVKGSLVKPFGIIHKHGWVETGITP